jgi:hypothetical protein
MANVATAWTTQLTQALSSVRCTVYFTEHSSAVYSKACCSSAEQQLRGEAQWCYSYKRAVKPSLVSVTQEIRSHVLVTQAAMGDSHQHFPF